MKPSIEEILVDIDKRVSRLEAAKRTYGPITAEPATPLHAGGPPWGVPYVSSPQDAGQAWHHAHRSDVTALNTTPPLAGNVCRPGGCAAIGCEGGHYCFDADGNRRLDKVFAMGATWVTSYGEDGPLLGGA
jgi:hypothetical protein